MSNLPIQTLSDRTLAPSGVLDSMPDRLVGRVDIVRLDAVRRLNTHHRSGAGQFLTPAPVARLMASMFNSGRDSIRLLDPGAGIGSLSAALVAAICDWENPPSQLSIVAYETEPLFIDYLNDTLTACKATCDNAGISFHAEIRQEDFIEAGCSMLKPSLLGQHEFNPFDCVILNPPYCKINSKSHERQLLSEIGVETGNLYTGFLAVAIQLLRQGGELVAITPRSFCNGPYFKPFRRLFLDTMSMRRIHVFEKRNQAFRDDEVLQENIIYHAIRDVARRDKVVIASSDDPHGVSIALREIDHQELVHPGDPNLFIRLVTDEVDRQIVRRMDLFTSTLDDLGISVSTGRVVDFRAKEFLRQNPTPQTVPLIYPGHLYDGAVEWPKTDARKPNALINEPKTDNLLVSPGIYVLTKRFSAKEEKKRVVAAIYDSAKVSPKRVGFENHLNYYHANGGGLTPDLAKGLAIFLNSTLVDLFFRQFNGHTQVNATDLRSLHYPPRNALERLGAKVGDTLPEQHEIDTLIEKELLPMTDDNSLDPIQTKAKIEETLQVLKSLGLPRQQQNERSALTLLALLDLKPDTPWANASDPLRGITQMMDYFAEHFGKTYAPNTRETVRRQTIHQFVQAGICLPNTDDPARPTNSPLTVYQIEPGVLELLRSYGTDQWTANLKVHLTSVETLKAQYARDRDMQRVPVEINEGTTITLSPGGQNVLVQKILDDFCPIFTPGGRIVHVGDTDNKMAYFDVELLADLGVEIQQHGKMPDVVVYLEDRNWLVLIEAVTSHGPVDPKRHIELKELFQDSTAGLVFVTTFLDRRSLVRFLSDIAWETEVWVADAPEHLIHFNGERFLGPYED